ncbi:stage II sporulation protein R [Bacillus sp. FJAT-49736]|uniref:stage II sporulation protein R n=1 Tax=Bacillus sp. FJAT-49736 TaxID=2833582 RepID=UPI001BC96C3D|nr:stage II sporulation protein R [Bacillus sp. FJAT-49736]MBS4175409.1 stage II sporulation protein R [Bacillus sp. FJAT-49736]
MNNKSLAWIYIIVLSLSTILSLYIPKQEAAAKDTIVIPKEAIRLRILANSDTPGDQALKRKVRDEVNKNITNWVQNIDSINKARKVIKSHLSDIKQIALKVVTEENSNQTVKVEFSHVQFPTKLYGQYLYPAGEYEAILITLGKGEGANWWCVLYPPLCFLDFSNGVAVSPGIDEEKHKKVNSEAKNKKEKETKQEIEDTNKKGSSTSENNNRAEEKDSESPVYAADKDDEVQVKFFIVELFKKLF